MDEYINILNNFINNPKKQCYEIEPIIIKKIQQSDIKLEESNANDIEKEINNCKTVLINKNNNKYYFKCELTSSNKFGLTVGEYVNANANANINNNKSMSSPESINMAMSYILSEIALREGVDNLLLPIFNLDFKKLQNKEITKHIKSKSGELYGNITEYYNETVDLIDYLKNNKLSLLEWKIMIFYIIYLLYIITTNMHFRHNKLDLSAFKIVKKKSEKKKIKFDDIIFDIPECKFTVKMCNFEHSTCSNYPYMKTPYKDNLYYDIHYLIQSIIYFYDENIKDKNSEELKELYKFCINIVPNKYQYNKKDFIGLDEEEYIKQVDIVLSPKLILKNSKNNFFSQFITKNMDLSVSPLSETSLTETHTKRNNKRMLAKNIKLTREMNLSRKKSASASSSTSKNNNIFGRAEKLSKRLSSSDGSSEESESEESGRYSKTSAMNTAVQNISPSSTSESEEYGKKSKRKHKKTNPLLKNLPDNYSGPLPDHLAMRLNEGGMVPGQMNGMPQQMPGIYPPMPTAQQMGPMPGMGMGMPPNMPIGQPPTMSNVIPPEMGMPTQSLSQGMGAGMGMGMGMDMVQQQSLNPLMPQIQGVPNPQIPGVPGMYPGMPGQGMGSAGNSFAYPPMNQLYGGGKKKVYKLSDNFFF